MILRCDTASHRSLVRARLIVTTVSVLELRGERLDRESEELVSEADAEYGFGWVFHHEFSDVLDCVRAHGGVTWTVAQEESIMTCDGSFDSITLHQFVLNCRSFRSVHLDRFYSPSIS